MNKIQFKRTKAEERVLIFRDIIAQLRAERFVSSPGIYVIPETDILPPGNTEAQKLLPRLGPCRVCQRGGIVLAMVRRYDCLPVFVGDYVGMTLANVAGDKRDPYVLQLFSAMQFLAMENAFEGRDAYTGAVSERRWVRAFPDPTDRMDAICRNGIANKGTFKISQIPAPRRVPLSVEIARRAK